MELQLPAAPTAPRMARAFLGDTLAQWHVEELFEVAALLASEVVTNVVRHVGTPMTVRVRRLPAALRVEVDDASTEQPTVCHVAPASERGRGVFLVDTLASAWGTDLGPAARGKTVWFELEIPSAAAHAHGS